MLWSHVTTGWICTVGAMWGLCVKLMFAVVVRSCSQLSASSRCVIAAANKTSGDQCRYKSWREGLRHKLFECFSASCTNWLTVNRANLLLSWSMFENTGSVSPSVCHVGFMREQYPPLSWCDTTYSSPGTFYTFLSSLSGAIFIDYLMHDV